MIATINSATRFASVCSSGSQFCETRAVERRTLRAGLNFTWTAWTAWTAWIALLALVSGALAVGPRGPTVGAATRRPMMATVKVIRTIPKSLDAFTEGLEIKNGVLYESTGLEGRSEIRTVDLRTGKVMKRAGLDGAFFRSEERRVGKEC